VEVLVYICVSVVILLVYIEISNPNQLEDLDYYPKQEEVPVVEFYQAQKEDVLVAGKAVSNSDFVETTAAVIEASIPKLISGGRAAELMATITHLLKCRRVCEEHSLLRETLDIG